MYDLGEHFHINLEDAISNEETTITGHNFRITVLGETLLRFEYNKDGVFLDKPSSFALNRKTPRSNNISIKEDDKFLQIESPNYMLFYRKESSFKGTIFNPGINLNVLCKDTGRVWHFGHKEVRNLKSPGFAFDTKGKIPMIKGLYSADGFVSFDDTKNKILDEKGLFVERDNKNIDTYLLIYGYNFTDALKDYFNLTGKPAFIPRYALGNWWGRNVTYNDDSLKELMDSFINNNIPLSVLLLNSDWHKRVYNDKYYRSGFSWNKDVYKNPEGMINYLHKQGVRIGLQVDPTEGIMPYEDNYQNVLKYLQPGKDGIVPFNVYDPKFLDVYLKVMIHPLDNMGIDFYFNDIRDIKFQKELWYLDHYQINDMKRNYEKRPMVLSRNPLHTPHRYPVLYSGKSHVKWKSLKDIMNASMHAANLGISWVAHDIGGYHEGTEDNELYTRFVQFGVFSSILKFGSEKGKYYKREPWKWGIKTFTIVKKYLELRHKLIPYLYNEAYKYYLDGSLVIKPVFYKKHEMYDDKNYQNEYYLGSELFIAPIVNKKDYVMNRVIHKFYIPEGIWYDFFTGNKFLGDKEYVSFYKDEDYPVFAKSGAIIPLGYNDNINDTTPPKNMEIHIFPGASNTYNMYEDDGVSDLYQKGFYLKSAIDYNYLPNNHTVIIRAIDGKSEIVPKTRNYKVIFRNSKAAGEVICYFNNVQTAYKSYLEDNNFVVEVKDVPTIGQLTINCKGSNIEIEAELLINKEIEDILSDLPIETKLKEEIDKIIFSDMPINSKRIALYKLQSKGLERKFRKLFLKLLDYLKTTT